jgi:hypothetical protein
MGPRTELLPRALTSVELSALTRVLELTLPVDAIVMGATWPGTSEGHRNYRLSMWRRRTALDPLHSTWLIERRADVYRLRLRPADADEIQMLIAALREVAADELDDTPAIAEADYDCADRTYQLCFTAFEDMREGVPYKRWILRRHEEARPLSVGFVVETRRGRDYATLPGGATLRGSPWQE